MWQLPELGGKKRVAAFLWFNKEPHDRFTLREIREAIGRNGEPEAAEHTNRRLRELRAEGWSFLSYKDARSVGSEEYILEVKGFRVWAGEGGTRPRVGQRTRREVLARDGYRCVLCGVGSGEPYPGEPETHAKMTIGHLRPQARAGARAKKTCEPNAQPATKRSETNWQTPTPERKSKQR